MPRINVYKSLLCKWCSKEFLGYINAKYCSKDCQRLYNYKSNEKKSVDASHLRYPDDCDPNSYIECKICGYRTTDLAQHPSVHGLSQKEYKFKYGNQIKCKNIIDKMSSEANPWTKHGGKYSPFSKSFTAYNNKDNTEEIIEELKAKCVEIKKENNSNPLTLSYYIAKGFTELEAKELLRNRQTTFTLDKLIEKHGQEVGFERWKERQIKWLATLNSKSDEEKLEINKKKLYKNGMKSKSETNLFNMLLEVTGLNLISQFELPRKDKPESLYVYDIVYNNKIIEFNGDFWHANPNSFMFNDIVKHPRVSKIAEDIWESDKKKCDYANELGYEVLIIWETDFKNRKNEVIAKCTNFLTQ